MKHIVLAGAAICLGVATFFFILNGNWGMLAGIWFIYFSFAYLLEKLGLK